MGDVIKIYTAPEVDSFLADDQQQIDSIDNNINTIESGLGDVVGSSAVSAPTLTPDISGIQYSNNVILTANGSITAFTENGVTIDHYEWILPDSSTISSNSITYMAPDNAHIGETLTFKCRAVDTLGNMGVYVSKDIIITDVIAPVINSISWDNNTHDSAGSYILTIDASDNIAVTEYIVTCDHNDVTIAQDSTNPNIFYITYPTWYNNVDVHYTITVKDIDNLSDIIYDTRSIIRTEEAPIIDNISWNSDTHSSGGSYDLTINATDLNNDNLTYTVTCDNTTNTIITQDETNPNIFHIVYNTWYDTNKDFTYTITVTDSTNRTDSTTDTKTVVRTETAPTIDSISWDNDTQVSAGSYSLTIIASDLNSDTLVYAMVADDTNVTITPDGSDPNIFHVTYPTYLNDTTVTYTITVTDSTSRTVVITNTKAVIRTEAAPVINSISWDNNTQVSAGSYDMTISATDPNSDPMTYVVTADDTNITITQDSTDLNIFHITYPTYYTNKIVTYTITVTDSTSLVTTTSNTKTIARTETAPTIDSIVWDNTNQASGGTYELTINASDLNNDPITYAVTCSNGSVTVTQDETNPNIFHITYPIFNVNTTVTYTITVTDNTTNTDSTTDTKTVARTETAPVINSITWNNNTHISSGSYDLTINATDLNNDTLTYSVSCNNGSVTVTQDGTNPNIFHIVYPTWYNDTTVIYTITVTDSTSRTDSTSDTKTVARTEAAPVINSIVWDNSSHNSGGSYSLTINANDLNSDSLTYTMTCNNGSVTVTQDGTNPNIFHVTYPTFYDNTTVIYTITVTDSTSRTDSTSDTKTVIKTEAAPVINSVSWNDNTHDSGNSYTMTINASDLNNDALTYTVICNNGSVTVTQDGTNPNIFHITYPTWYNDTTVTYTITVTDSTNRTVNSSDTKTVARTEVAPTINSITWSNNTHISGGSYDLTINATDPNNDPLTYTVTSNNSAVTITQNTTNKNIFHVVYNTWYDADKSFTYTITVKDSTNRTTSTSSVKTVAKTEATPVINSLTWDDDNHESRGTYVLTITASDLNNDISTYKLTADDPNVTIVQNGSNPNIFTVTYPTYL